MYYKHYMMNQTHNLKFVVISNICFEPYLRRSLEGIYGNKVVLSSVPLSELQDTTHYETLHNADYIIVVINLEARFPNLTDEFRTGVFSVDEIVGVIEMEYRTTADYLTETTSAPIFWFSFEDYGIRARNLFGATPYLDCLVEKINKMLFVHKTDRITCLDMQYLIACVGIANSYDIRGKYRWNSPYSKELIAEMVGEIDRQIRVLNGETKKCIVVDCDNVLWGGIVSEDGIESIKLDSGGLGREYQDFQRYLKILYDYGIILAVCSKNDSNDVMRMFREHNAMVLREKHISCFRVNWQDKAENIKEIAAELNIGLDSIVFVDDSEFEVQSIRALLPEVASILYNKKTIMSDLAGYIRLNDRVSYKNAIERQNTYSTNRKREELRAECSSFNEYLNSLEMQVDVHIAVDSELNRISELTQRANQCTTGVRYSVNDLKNHIANSGSLYAVYVNDKYSDLGLVGAIGMNGKCLTLFALSCRALGRKVEDKMLDFVIERNVREVIWKDTGKNGAMKEKISLKNMIIQ